MKKMLFFVLLSLVFYQTPAPAQIYYQISKVYDMQMHALPRANADYKTYMEAPIMINLLGNSVYIWLGYVPAGCYSYPIAGQDNNGNYIYAQPDLYGNPTMYNFMGQPDYLLIAPDMHRIRHALAYSGCIVDAEQITSEEYFALTSQYNNQLNPYGGGIYGGGSTGNDFDYNGGASPSANYVQEPCSFCNGTGDSPIREYAPDYTGGHMEQKYCPICKAYADPHYHKKCPSCGGKGYTLKRK